MKELDKNRQFFAKMKPRTLSVLTNNRTTNCFCDHFFYHHENHNLLMWPCTLGAPTTNYHCDLAYSELSTTIPPKKKLMWPRILSSLTNRATVDPQTINSTLNTQLSNVKRYYSRYFCNQVQSLLLPAYTPLNSTNIKCNHTATENKFDTCMR